MKQLILLFIALTLAPLCFSQTGTIRGHLHNTDENKGFVGAAVYLVGTRTGTQSNLEGDFEFDSIPVGIYDLNISFIGFQDSTLTSIQVSEDTVINLDINYPPPCIYSKKNNICPICHKKDEVIPIVYGFPSKKTMKVAKKGIIKLGGCNISGCDPYWYCKRDKKEF